MAERKRREDDSVIPESGTVTVACKLPNGLQLQVCKEEEFTEPVAGGGFKTSKRFRKTGEVVVLHPARVPYGVIPEYKIIGGYSLTEDVDAQFFAIWLEQHKDTEMVKNRLIFAYEKADVVSSAARERKGVRSGLEPISQGTPDGKNNDPRMPKDIRVADRKEMVA